MDQLKGKQILIVEDHRELSSCLCEVFEKATQVPPIPCMSIAEALDEIRRIPRRFDGVILDMMLPLNATTRKQIEGYEDQLDGMREEIRSAAGDEDQYEAAVEKRQYILAEINQLIQKDGGAKVAEEVAGLLSVDSGGQIPVLFLTCVGDPRTQDEMLNKVPLSEWLTKPEEIQKVLSTLNGLFRPQTAKDM